MGTASPPHHHPSWMSGWRRVRPRHLTGAGGAGNTRTAQYPSSATESPSIGSPEAMAASHEATWASVAPPPPLGHRLT